MISDILPAEDDMGITVGRPQFVADKNLKMLNADIDHTIGLATKNKLSESVLLVKEQIDTECGVFTKLKAPANETTQFYQLLSVRDDDDVHLVKAGSTKNKDKRRQMASTSVRNLGSHLCAISYSNFRPTTEKWHHPKNISRGAKELLKLMKDVTGSHFKPIYKVYQKEV